MAPLGIQLNGLASMPYIHWSHHVLRGTITSRLVYVWTTPIGRFDPMTDPSSTKSIYQSTKEPDMGSMNPDYSWNLDAKGSMPTYAAPSSYAFGNDGAAQMIASLCRAGSLVVTCWGVPGRSFQL
jgi:hypothetical protein